MTDYKTISDHKSKAHLELLDKQTKILEKMTTPTVMITQKTLRDEFAMAALTGLLANPKLAPTILNKGPSWFDDNAYAFADAMMEARK
jgi:hypothetical protein